MVPTVHADLTEERYILLFTLFILFILLSVTVLGITLSVEDLLVGVVAGAAGRFPGGKARLPETREKFYIIFGETEVVMGVYLSCLIVLVIMIGPNFRFDRS